MKRKTGLKIISFCCAIATAFLATVFTKPTKVFADDTATETAVSAMAGTTVSYDDVKTDVEACYNALTMYEGASVKIKKVANEDNTTSFEGSGLRFGAPLTGITEEQVSKWTVAGVKFGVLIIPKDKLKQSDGTYAEVGEAYLTHASAFDCAGAPVLVNGTYELHGILLDIKMNHYVRDYVGRAYIATPNADGTYAYHFAAYYGGNVENNTRSIYYVAQLAQMSNPSAQDSIDAKTFYMDAWANNATYGTKKYKYYLDYTYVNLDGTTEVVSEAKGDTLNKDIVVGIAGSHPTPTYAVEQTVEVNGRTYKFDAARTDLQGVVQPSGRLHIPVYYYEYKDTESGATGTTDKSLAGLITNKENATEAYFGGEMHAVTNDQGEITIQTSGTNGEDGFWGNNAQSDIMLTAEFIYDLQQAGYKSITIGEVSCEAWGIGLGLAKMTGFNLSGYVTAGPYKYNSTQVYNNLYIDITNTIYKGNVTDENGTTYSYYTLDSNGNKVGTSGITIDAEGNFSSSWAAQWVLSDITLA